MVKHSQTIRQVSRQMQVAIDKLSYQPEKLYTEALLEVLGKTIAEEINAVLKNECMACYEPAVQVHSYYLSDPQEKVDRNLITRSN